MFLPAGALIICSTTGVSLPKSSSNENRQNDSFSAENDFLIKIFKQRTEFTPLNNYVAATSLIWIICCYRPIPFKATKPALIRRGIVTEEFCKARDQVNNFFYRKCCQFKTVLPEENVVPVHGCLPLKWEIIGAIIGIVYMTSAAHANNAILQRRDTDGFNRGNN